MKEVIDLAVRAYNDDCAEDLTLEELQLLGFAHGSASREFIRERVMEIICDAYIKGGADGSGSS